MFGRVAIEVRRMAALGLVGEAFNLAVGKGCPAVLEQPHDLLHLTGMGDDDALGAKQSFHHLAKLGIGLATAACQHPRQFHRRHDANLARRIDRERLDQARSAGRL